MCRWWYGSAVVAALSVGSNLSGPVYAATCVGNGTLGECTYTLTDASYCNHSADAVVSCRNDCSVSMTVSNVPLIQCSALSGEMAYFPDTESSYDVVCRALFGPNSSAGTHHTIGTKDGAVRVSCGADAVSLGDCNVFAAPRASAVAETGCLNVYCTFDSFDSDDVALFRCPSMNLTAVGYIPITVATQLCRWSLGTGLVLGDVRDSSTGTSLRYQSFSGKGVIVDLFYYHNYYEGSAVRCSRCSFQLGISGAPLRLLCDSVEYRVCATGVTSHTATLVCSDLYGEPTTGSVGTMPGSMAAVSLDCDNSTALSNCTIAPLATCSLFSTVVCIQVCRSLFFSGTPLVVTCNTRAGAVTSEGLLLKVADSLCRSRYGNASLASLRNGSNRGGLIFSPSCSSGSDFGNCSFSRCRSCNHADDVVIDCTHACSVHVAHGSLFAVSCDSAPVSVPVCFSSSVAEINDLIATELCSLFYGEEFVGRWFPSQTSVVNGAVMHCGTGLEPFNVLQGFDRCFFTATTDGSQCVAAVTHCWIPVTPSTTVEVTQTVAISVTDTHRQTASEGPLSATTSFDVTGSHSLSVVCGAADAEVEKSSKMPTIFVSNRSSESLVETNVTFQLSVGEEGVEVIPRSNVTIAIRPLNPMNSSFELFYSSLRTVLSEGVTASRGNQSRVVLSATVVTRWRNTSVKEVPLKELQWLPIVVSYLQRRCVTTLEVPVTVILLEPLAFAPRVRVLAELRSAASIVGAVTAAPLTLLGCPIGLVGAYGGSVLAELAACDFNATETASAWDSPTQLSLGSVSEGASQRGGAIGSTVAMLVVMLLAAFVAAAQSAWDRDSPDDFISRWIRQTEQLSLPAVLNAPFLLLLPSALGQAVTLLMYRWAVLDVVIGACVVVVWAAAAASTALPATRYFPTSLRDTMQQHAETDDAASLRAMLSTRNVFRILTDWDKLAGRTRFYQRYGMTFEHLRYRVRWFAAVEVMVAVVSVVVGGIGRTSNVTLCTASSGFLAALYVCFGAGVLYWRPYNTPFGLWVALGNTWLSLVTAVLALAQYADAAVVLGCIQTCCGLLSLALAIGQAVAAQRLLPLLLKRLTFSSEPQQAEPLGHAGDGCFADQPLIRRKAMPDKAAGLQNSETKLTEVLLAYREFNQHWLKSNPTAFVRDRSAGLKLKRLENRIAYVNATRVAQRDDVAVSRDLQLLVSLVCQLRHIPLPPSTPP